MIQFTMPEKVLYNFPSQEIILSIELSGCIGYALTQPNQIRYPLGFTIMGPAWTEHLLQIKREHIQKLEAEKAQCTNIHCERLKQWDIDFRMKEVDFFSYVEVPLAHAYQQYRDNDTDCEYYKEDEKKDRLAPTWVKGKPQTVEEMRLEPGDRFIDMHCMHKYTLIRQTSKSRGDMYPGSIQAIDEWTRREVSVKDHQIFSKMPGKGDLENIRPPRWMINVAPKEPAIVPDKPRHDKAGQILMF